MSTSESGFIDENEKRNNRAVKKDNLAALHTESNCITERIDQHLVYEQQPLSASEKEALEKWKDMLSETKHYYQAYFILGPMCSGKTSTIRDTRCTQALSCFAYVDTDEIMKGLDGYDDSAIDTFYPSARKVSIHLTDWLLDECISFIAEGTCVKYDELIDYMKRLRESGYNIKVKKIDDVPLDILLSRADKRVSRRVAQEVVKDIYLKSNYGLVKLWEANERENLFEEFV